MKKILLYPLLIISISIGLYSCSAFIKIDPPINEIEVADAFTDSAKIIIAANGLYTYTMNNQAYTYFLNVIATPIADEGYHVNPQFDPFVTNRYTPESSYMFGCYQFFYAGIHVQNLFIDQLALSDPSLLSESKRNKFTAEAKFFRAYGHLALALLHGNIPYITTSDVNITKDQGQMPLTEILENIVVDLLWAEEALAGENISNIYISVHAVRALLARVYTYQEEWTKAEQMAAKVINESGAILEDDLGDIYLRSGKEAIFKGTSGNSPNNGRVDHCVLGYWSKSVGYFYIIDELLADFEKNDLRYDEWVLFNPKEAEPEKAYRANKYKLNSRPDNESEAEDFIILRLAEQILIRAEANINLGNLDKAHTDLNKIRTRAGLPELKNLGQQELREALYQERRIELFYEYCHRWADLSRWGIIDDVLGSVKAKHWQPHAALLPIPQDQMNRNPNLVQNPGYSK